MNGPHDELQHLRAENQNRKIEIKFKSKFIRHIIIKIVYFASVSFFYEKKTIGTYIRCRQTTIACRQKWSERRILSEAWTSRRFCFDFSADRRECLCFSFFLRSLSATIKTNSMIFSDIEHDEWSHKYSKEARREWDGQFNRWNNCRAQRTAEAPHGTLK